MGKGAYTDLFELFPADGYFNSLRGNLPLGYVEGKGTKESTNGSKIGPCKSKKAPVCFEVADNMKGDIARSYFYLSMAYRDEWTCCKVPNVVNKWNMDKWMEDDLRAWHKKDKVDLNEKMRNDAI